MKKGKMMRKKDVYNKAKQVYGIDAQVTKAIEELSELQKELCKFLLDDSNIKNIAEETADVKIMIDQIELMLEIKEEVKAFKKAKIQRLSDRLDEEPQVRRCENCLFKSSPVNDEPCFSCSDKSKWKINAE
jgi:dsDNA-specific endonuclease/ATPase MutS2